MILNHNLLGKFDDFQSLIFIRKIFFNKDNLTFKIIIFTNER